MYFDLTEDQKAIAETVGTLLEDHLSADRALKAFDAEKLDRGLWRQLCEMGVGRLLVPEAQDGLGLDLVTLAAIQERLGWAAAPAPLTETVLGAWLLAVGATAEQRARWLQPIAAGEAIVAFALDEPTGVQPESWTMDRPRLNGVKPLVPWAIDADLFVVGVKGGALHLVEKQAEGVSVRAVPATDRSRPMGDVSFADASGDLLTDDAETVGRLMDGLYIAMAADACGAGNRALQLAVDYANTRKQFDRLIGTFQGLKHQLADLAVDLEPARYLVWYAAHAWDVMPKTRSYAAALAKAHLGDIAVKTARGAVEAHGGIGYTWEYPLHIYLKRAMFDRSALGPPSLHRIRSAALAGW